MALRHHSSLDDEAVKIIMTTLADIRADVQKFRKEIVEENGEEEAEGDG